MIVISNLWYSCHCLCQKLASKVKHCQHNVNLHLQVPVLNIHASTGTSESSSSSPVTVASRTSNVPVISAVAPEHSSPPAWDRIELCILDEIRAGTDAYAAAIQAAAARGFTTQKVVEVGHRYLLQVRILPAIYFWPFCTPWVT